MPESEVTDAGRWQFECGQCGNVMRIKNLTWRASVAEPCEWCRKVMADEDDSNERDVPSELGWCGCGSPDQINRLMLDFLTATDERKAFDSTFDPYEDANLLLGYIADSVGWTDHGTSIGYVWITDDGREALTNLRQICERDEATR